MSADRRAGEDIEGELPAGKPAARDARFKGRLTMLAVLAVGVLPLLAALYFRYVSPPVVDATVGKPLDPVSLPFESLIRLDGKPLSHPTVSSRWMVVFAAPGACDARCQHTLYLTRQARTAQGRNMERIDRVWLITDDTTPAAGLLAAHPDLITARATEQKVFQVLGGSSIRYINLVDRRGLVVFRYPDDPEPKAFIKELGKLIRF